MVDWYLNINAREFISTLLAFIGYLRYSLVAFFTCRVFGNNLLNKLRYYNAGSHKRNIENKERWNASIPNMTMLTVRV